MPKSSKIAGLRCLSKNCGGLTRVVRTNHTTSGSQTRRVRVCRLCGRRWATSEAITGPRVSRDNS